MKDLVTLGMIGHGVVGSGTLQLLREQAQSIEHIVGAPVQVKWVCRRRPSKSPSLGKNIRITRHWEDVVNDPDVDCIVELIGGIDPAKQIITEALKKGKHVVTANKAVLARYWDEVFGIANAERRLVYFEAAVGGGIPVVQALNEGMAGNRITKIFGILNGTTNFILTKMQESGLSFYEALKQARIAGFAEANPTFDLNGTDTAQKISILGSLAAGAWISPDNVFREGISQLQLTDIRMIQDRLHSTIKLLGIVDYTKSGWVLRVHPTLVSNSHPFANIRNEYNAIWLHGNPVGDVMLSGKGAGKLPTSSSVVSDIIFLCRQIANETAGQLPYVTRRSRKKIKISTIDAVSTRYYLRINTQDKPGVLSKITGILSKHNVSIASVHQDSADTLKTRRRVPIILLTHENLEANVQSAVNDINELPTTLSRTVVLRIL